MAVREPNESIDDFRQRAQRTKRPYVDVEKKHMDLFKPNTLKYNAQYAQNFKNAQATRRQNNRIRRQATLQHRRAVDFLRNGERAKTPDPYDSGDEDSLYSTRDRILLIREAWPQRALAPPMQPTTDPHAQKYRIQHAQIHAGRSYPVTRRCHECAKINKMTCDLRQRGTWPVTHPFIILFSKNKFLSSARIFPCYVF